PPILLDGNGQSPTDLTRKFLSKRLFVISSPGRTVDTITSDETFRCSTAKTSNGPEEYLQKRISQLARFSNWQILFEIPGNSKHKVGDCVEIDLRELHQVNPTTTSSSSPTDFESVESKYYSGHYL